MGDTFTSNRLNGLLRKNVETVNHSITALKCGANEIFKTRPLSHLIDTLAVGSYGVVP